MSASAKPADVISPRRDMAHVVTLIERHSLFPHVQDKLRLVAEADPSRAIPMFVAHIDKVATPHAVTCALHRH
jgi:hypothetical protein